MKKSLWLSGVGALVLVSLIIAGIMFWPRPAAPAGETHVDAPGGGYTDVTPQRLAKMLADKDFVFINTHIPYEGEIEQTDAFIPFEENGPQRVSEYPADKNAKIILYCRSGRMSTIVAKELVQAGYTHVWNLAGGMVAWEKAGYELIRK
jgi:rhodanese-related sulfurtransferase